MNSIINEALSKAYKQSIDKIKLHLIEKQGLNSLEATYITEFYTAVKELNLFASKYFKEFDYDGELFDLNNIQKFAKYPEAFYDIVMLVMHSDTLLDNLDVSFDGLTVKLSKKEVLDKKVETYGQSTIFDDYKVAEDKNYYTFYMPDYKVAKEFRTFYGKVYPDDKDISNAENSDFFYSNWCVVSSNAKTYFNSQKYGDTNGVWFITYSKRNPAQKFRENFVVDHVNKRIIYIALGTDSSEYRNANFGEIYFRRSKNAEPHGNHGYHIYSNYPGTGFEESRLEPPTSYSYESIDIASKGVKEESFTISGGKLTSVESTKEIIVVPDGVTEIMTGAFNDLKEVKQIVMPFSLTRIRKHAFDNLPNLKIVSVSNNLEVIESNAFINMGPTYDNTFSPDKLKQNVWRDLMADANIFVIGVIEQGVGGGYAYTINKPSKLRYAPRDIVYAYRHLEGLGKDIATESKRRKVKKESFRVKRELYAMTDLYSIEREDTLIIDADPAEAHDVKVLKIPEGVKTIEGSLKSFRKLEVIEFPSTLESIDYIDFSGSTLALLDLSKTKIRNIRAGQFRSMLNLEIVKLPESIDHIERNAFEGSGLESINIPMDCIVDEDVFKNCVFLEEIQVAGLQSFIDSTAARTMDWLQKNKIKIKETGH